MEYIEKYKEELIRQGIKSPNTIEAYIRALNDFKCFIEDAAGEEFKSEEIIELDVKEYKSHLLNVKKQSPATINQKLSALASFYDYLHAEDIVKNNPAAAIKKIKVQDKKTAPEKLEKNELYRLRREFYKSENQRDILVFELLYNVGMRVSELCNVELDDYEISERKGIIKIRKGKGDKYREVPLNSEARKAILNYLEVRSKIKSNKLLIGERGEMSRSGVYRIVEKYSKISGVQATPHTLRHQFCHDLLAAGESISTVAELAGHSDINVTYRYTLATKKEKQEAVEKLNNVYL